MKPKVTVVITCHNYGRYLKRCVESVQKQTYSHIEIVIVDDASTDETQEVCREIRNQAKILRFESRRGLAMAANRGLLQSDNGPYLMRLDADDWLDPHCIANMVNVIEIMEAAAVYSDYWKVDGDERGYRAQPDGEIPLGSCVLMRREIFENLDGYNQSLKFQEDYDLLKRMKSWGELEAVHLPLWYYRQHSEQMSSAHNERMRARQAISNGPKILTVIPARGGSKGVPRKNLYPLAGVPLVVRAIRMVKASGIDTLIAVSTEDSEIEEVAVNAGVDVIRRPPELAEDDVSTIPVVKHAMEWIYDIKEWSADTVISVQPTCPYTPPEALKAGVARHLLGGVDSVVSCAEVTGKHPYRTYRMCGGGGILHPLFPEFAEAFLQRQDRPKAYEFTGGFYIRNRSLLENWNGKDFALGKTFGMIVPKWAAVDIDDEMDLWTAEAIVKHWNEVADNG